MFLNDSSSTNASDDTDNQFDVRVFRDPHHSESILKSMNNQRSENKYCDIKIKVKQTEFPCHKAVLAKASPQLAIILDKECLGILEINSISEETMDSLLNFMYLGSISISARNARKIFVASHFLKIASVQNAALDFLQSNIDVSNCLELYIFAQLYNCIDLEQKAFLFASKNFDKLWHGRDFLELTEPQLTSILSADEIRRVVDEKFVFLAAQRWFSKHRKEQIILVSIMETVRFHLMDCHFLQNCCEVFPALKCTPKVKEMIEKAKLMAMDNSEISSNITLSIDSTVEIVVVGYLNNESGNRASCCYHPESNQWFYGNESLYSPNIAAVTYMGSQVYAIFEEKNRQYLCELNETSGGWQNVESEGLEPMEFIFGFSAFDYCLYVVGMCESLKRFVVKKFSFESNKWCKDSSFVYDSHYLAPIVVGCNQNFYIAGDCNNHKYFMSFNKYDLTSRKVSTLPDMSKKRGGLSACVLENFIYIIGGENIDHSSSIVQRYDMKTNSWQTVSSMIIARNFPSVIVKSGKIYVFGGNGYEETRSVECYDPVVNEWKIISEIPNNLLADVIFKFKIRKSSLKKFVM